MASPWTQDFPLYVSREYDGRKYQMSSPFWLVMLIYVLVLLNAVAWGSIGLVEVVQYIIGAF